MTLAIDTSIDAPAQRRDTTLRVLVRMPAALIGLALIAVVVFASVVLPWLMGGDPEVMDLPGRLQSPAGGHLAGTDAFGRDLFLRLLYGGRISLLIGVVAVAIGAVAGAVIGAVSGFFGGPVDQVLMRVMDALISFPAVLLAMGMIAILGSGLVNLMLAVGIATIPVFARVMRGEVLRVRELDFVTAAHTLGGSRWRVLWSHVLPNTIAVVIVVATLQVASAILAAASLSFLGLGVAPPTAEWGSMLAEGRMFFNSAPWMLVAPAVAIVLTVLGFNILGDALRDALDPALKRRRS